MDRFAASCGPVPDKKPRVVNKPPDWSYWNRIAIVTLHRAVCLTINLDPRSYFATSANKSRYKEMLDIAWSHICNGSLSSWGIRRNLKASASLRVADWIEWLLKMDIPIPDGWRPIGLALKLDELVSVVGGPCWEEAVCAAVKMKHDQNVPTPEKHEKLYEFMLDKNNNEIFPNCCKGLSDWKAVEKRVLRERQHEEITSPLCDPRFLKDS